jgi:hypothetical protein
VSGRRLPRTQRRFLRRRCFRLSCRIAEQLENTTGSLDLTIRQQGGRFAQRFATEIRGCSISFNAIQKCRDLDQLGPNPNEFLIYDPVSWCSA